MIRGADRQPRAGGSAGSKTLSMALEIIERLATALAAPQRLAGSGAEFGKHFGILGAALRTAHLKLAEQRAARASPPRRRDAVFFQLSAAVVAHPVSGPGRRQHGAN